MFGLLVFISHGHSRPIRGQSPGHVISPDQSEASLSSLVMVWLAALGLGKYNLSFSVQCENLNLDFRAYSSIVYSAMN